jgi:hypothetical protein
LTSIFLRLVECLLINVGTHNTLQTAFLAKVNKSVAEYKTQLSQYQHQYWELKVAEFREKRKVNFDNLGDIYGSLYDSLYFIIKKSSLSSKVILLIMIAIGL